MPDLVPIRRALISVSDKTGLADFATALVREFKVELISTGGTAKFLRDAQLPVIDVSQVTGFPEMMDGRVKTLHPRIHGGLLALRDNPQHVKAMQEHGIVPIDLVCINLYPFKKTIEKPGVEFEEAIENIDIGGPSMIRSAAKNHRSVLVVTSPDRYAKVLGDLREHVGSSCGKHRLRQAQRAFAHTAAYDVTIAGYLSDEAGVEYSAPQRSAPLRGDSIGQSRISLPELKKQQDLRYGENPHQRAALYVPLASGQENSPEASVARAKQLHGKELSYINLLDADAAMSVVKEFDRPAACVVKHATPCGVAWSDRLIDAFTLAYEGDPLAAFGGIVALNRKVDRSAAETITQVQKLLEVIVAPHFDADALEVLKTRWKNVRLLEVGPVHSLRHLQQLGPDAIQDDVAFHKIIGGYLLQQRDLSGLNETDWKIVSKRQPSEAEWADLRLAWLACKHVKSNAIVIARGGAAVGIGGGQVDRVNAARIAVAKADHRAQSAVAASDAFFPFPDGPELLLNAGVTAIIHPGGAMRDHETLALCDARNAALILTGQRHFRH